MQEKNLFIIDHKYNNKFWLGENFIFYVRINNNIRKFYAKNFRTNFKKDDIGNKYYITISIKVSFNDFYYLELIHAIPTRVKFHIINDTASNL